MTDAQREILLIIDEWWKNHGHGPSIDDIMLISGERGRGNVHRKIKALVDLGFLVKVRGRARSVRPKGMRVNKIENS
jgi:SOS-response transcriptional repressor LexA